MKAFLLLIFLGIVAFLVASVPPVQDTTPLQQETEIISEELSAPIFSEENLKEPEDKPEESEVKEEVIVIEKEPVPEVIVLPEKEEEMAAEIPNEVIPVTVEEITKVSFSEINTSTRAALVNIFCTTKSGGSFKPITGSGIIIDERGVVLTNAHVAQYFLLKDYLVKDFIQCSIRTGSPARPKYKATPIFISPSWVQNNTDSIVQQSPKGTGEDDYALLLITQRTDPQENIPEAFSFAVPEYNSGKIGAGDEVLLAAYPAGFLGGISIQKDLYISSTITKVMELFTFGSGTLDVFSIGGSVVAQQGSSGGAVVGGENKLLGIIVTSSVAESTQDRDLRAITIAHINRSFVKDTGFDLQTLFAGDIKAEADAFNENIAPALTQLLVDELEK